jgi:hypothetical protein
VAAEPPRHGRHVPDAYEIGYTWRTRSAVRTAANIEAKLLMPACLRGVAGDPGLFSH